MKQTVAREVADGLRAACRASSRSISTVEAPKRSGKQSRPPSPNVNASGGVPQKTSSAAGLRHERGKASHIAITSRWKCMLPFGWPVVPDVKAISADVVGRGVDVRERRRLAVERALRASRAPPSLK